MIATSPLLVEIDRIAQCTAPRAMRSLVDFAAAELVVPDGPFAGERLRWSRQPITRLVLDAMGRGDWRRIALTGCVQSGKTLCGLILPVMHALFERRVSVILAAPSMQMAADKWRVDLLPAIRQSRFSTLLPRNAGAIDSGQRRIVSFRHGPSLRLMAGSGDDKRRAGFSAACVCMTEVDGMDTARLTSREADPVTQLEQRAAAFGPASRIILECTVSTDRGRIWREYLGGTQSRIACPCVHCGAWVCPEREHLRGWHDARDLTEAKDLASWACPACGASLDETQRRAMLTRARIEHHDGSVDGDCEAAPQRTDTLSLRWHAWHNAFWTTADIAAREWRARRHESPESAERELRQFVWTIPVLAEADGLHRADPLTRIGDTPRGVVPPWGRWFVVGIDVGRYALHWTAAAFDRAARMHVVAYGVQDTQADALGEERGILLALRALRDTLATTFVVHGGGVAVPALVLVDSGYRADVVYAFSREALATVPAGGVPAMAAKGFGLAQTARRRYVQPSKRSESIRRVGAGWHVARIPAAALDLVEHDADAAKTWLAARLSAPANESGSFSLHAGTARDHLAFAKHLDSEREVLTWHPLKGWLTHWEARRSANHWLDATALACVGAMILGVHPLAAPPPPPVPPPSSTPDSTRDRSPTASSTSAASPGSFPPPNPGGGRATSPASSPGARPGARPGAHPGAHPGAKGRAAFRNPLRS